MTSTAKYRTNMKVRAAAALIFAFFGALTVLIMTLVINGARQIDADVFPIAGLAAISAALMAAWLSPRFSKRPVLLGIVTMLLAHIPFSFLATGYLTYGDAYVSLRDLAQFFFMVLFIGWFIAGLFQITTGALAGLVMRRWLRDNPPQDNNEDVFR